jgi:hypothetical protein
MKDDSATVYDTRLSYVPEREPRAIIKVEYQHSDVLICRWLVQNRTQSTRPDFLDV